MKKIEVQKLDGSQVASQGEAAENLRERWMGLLGRREMPAGGGLWLEPCSAIHTWFMKMKIDAVFVDSAGKVLRVEPHLSPWRLCFGGGKAVLELPAGRAVEAGLKVGDQLLVKEISSK